MPHVIVIAGPNGAGPNGARHENGAEHGGTAQGTTNCARHGRTAHGRNDDERTAVTATRAHGHNRVRDCSVPLKHEIKLRLPLHLHFGDWDEVDDERVVHAEHGI